MAASLKAQRRFSSLSFLIFTFKNIILLAQKLTEKKIRKFGARFALLLKKKKKRKLILSRLAHLSFRNRAFALFLKVTRLKKIRRVLKRKLLKTKRKSLKVKFLTRRSWLKKIKAYKPQDKVVFLKLALMKKASNKKRIGKLSNKQVG